MSKPTHFRIFNLGLLLAFALLFSARNAGAQTAAKVFKVGETVEVNVANDIENEDRWIKGTVTEILYTDDGRILSYKVKRDPNAGGDGGYVQQFLNRPRVIRPAGGGGAAVNAPAKPVSRNEATQTMISSTSTSKANGDCSFEKPPAVTASMKFTETLIKSALYERFGFEKETGGLSSPLDVGLTFLNLQLGDSFTNTVTVEPARGARRRFDLAPPDATVYRFHAKFIVCRKFSNAVKRTQYDGDNVCFKAANGNWSCPTDGDQHVTQLD